MWSVWISMFVRLSCDQMWCSVDMEILCLFETWSYTNFHLAQIKTQTKRNGLWHTHRRQYSSNTPEWICMECNSKKSTQNQSSLITFYLPLFPPPKSTFLLFNKIWCFLLFKLPYVYSIHRWMWRRFNTLSLFFFHSSFIHSHLFALTFVLLFEFITFVASLNSTIKRVTVEVNNVCVAYGMAWWLSKKPCTRN